MAVFLEFVLRNYGQRDTRRWRLGAAQAGELALARLSKCVGHGQF
jgi:hypothetical protein